MSDMKRDEFTHYLDIARAEAKASAAELHADLKAGMDAMSVDVANLKTDARATFAVHAKWNAAIGFGVIVAVTTIVGMFQATSPAAAPTIQTPPPVPYVIHTQTPAPEFPATPASHVQSPPRTIPIDVTGAAANAYRSRHMKSS